MPRLRGVAAVRANVEGDRGAGWAELAGVARQTPAFVGVGLDALARRAAGANEAPPDCVPSPRG